jgi:hypothetical protein
VGTDLLHPHHWAARILFRWSFLRCNWRNTWQQPDRRQHKLGRRGRCGFADGGVRCFPAAHTVDDALLRQEENQDDLQAITRPLLIALLLSLPDRCGCFWPITKQANALAQQPTVRSLDTGAPCRSNNCFWKRRFPAPVTVPSTTTTSPRLWRRRRTFRGRLCLCDTTRNPYVRHRHPHYRHVVFLCPDRDRPRNAQPGVMIDDSVRHGMGRCYDCAIVQETTTTITNRPERFARGNDNAPPTRSSLSSIGETKRFRVWY